MSGHRVPETARALLFDCDGTLVDTLGLYRICWHQVFGRHGFDMSDEFFDSWASHPMAPFLRAAFPDADDHLMETLAEEGVALFLESRHLLEPLDHIVAIARENHGRIPMAVVSGGPRNAVVATLDAVGITELFERIVTADDVLHSKPAPDCYLLAARLIGVAPEHCVAYEDSAVGMEAAKKAGIPSIFDVRHLLP